MKGRRMVAARGRKEYKTRVSRARRRLKGGGSGWLGDVCSRKGSRSPREEGEDHIKNKVTRVVGLGARRSREQKARKV
jgi:hypothetical protein